MEISGSFAAEVKDFLSMGTEGDSNPTSRVMDVLNFLAAHPTETFTLAEIARHVGLSNGSAHRVLTTMARSQFLSRDEKRRTYSLGVAMVAIGQAAIERHHGVERARREIARLAVELDVQCSASTVAADELMVLVREGAPKSHLGLTRVGERRPLIPPVGFCHVAWAGEAAIEAYIGRVDAYLDETVRRHLRAAFPLIRRRGYAMSMAGPNGHHARQVMAMPNGRPPDAAYWSSVFDLVGKLTPDEMQLFDIAAAGEAGISHITAPVFSASGTVSMQLVITGMARDRSARDIESYAERLCATAARITSELHGRLPKA